ncbi:MAG: aldolase [Sphingomonadales bacterium]|nr:aldolase [Sphingomonadales bacterium]PIX66413.1 MAG: aldolase [Sphingomonadales bacterium CG_4_10_14_3_um_filter_58_15]NCO48046.1 aldolase [Sphingomonadales bacterium]NCP01560.1 aldolase [Sphingomonadales bacterium]NCP27179.1 aldolase [Sphingomonadales bacterium]
MTIHATAVAISGAGLLIRGKSGSGKSDLALRLIDRGATLISDDQVNISRKDRTLLLSPPASLAGKLELRSLGIWERNHVSGIDLKLIIDLVEQPERFPMDNQVVILLGIKVPSCTLNAMETSAAIKAEWAVQRIMQGATGS